MRIIRLKLNTDTCDYIRILANRLKTNDVSFVEDLYALCVLKGSGLPDDARCDKFAEFYSKAKSSGLPNLARIFIRKRRQTLKALISTAMFSKWLKNNCAQNTLEFVEELLTSFRLLHRKLRQSECMSCSLMSDCDFGKQYGKAVRSFRMVYDPDYSKKVNANCPHLPEISFLNEINKAAQFANGLANPHNAAAMKNSANAGGVGSGEISEICANEQEAAEIAAGLSQDTMAAAIDPDDFPPEDLSDEVHAAMVDHFAGKGTQHNDDSMIGGAGIILDAKVIERLTSAQLLLYQLALKLDSLLEKSAKGKFKPVEQLTKQSKTAHIKSIAEVSKVKGTEHALPGEVFDAKLVRRELRKVQQEEPEHKKQLLYILLDVSGSMSSPIGSQNTTFGYVTRAALASAFGIALCRRIRDDQGVLYMRPFSGSPGRLHACKLASEFSSLETYFAEANYGGMSTDIPAAISQAILDINSARDELARAEVLLITDACDPDMLTKEVEIRNKLGDVALNTLDVAEIDERGSEALKKISDNYFKFDSSSASFDKMVTLVGGKKQMRKV